MPDIQEAVASLHRKFATGVTRPYKWRAAQIRAIVKMITDHEQEFAAAVAVDLKKPAIEFQLGEIGNICNAANEILSNLQSWMKNQTEPCLGFLFPATCEARMEPYGVVLIIGPFNYPIQLTLKPLMGAIAAGNCAVVKPSELTPATSAVLARLLPQYLDSECVKVVEGGVAETQALLAQPLDFIAFTGSNRVGKIIAKAAAEQMIPCLLELGGKNAAIIDERVDSLEVVAKRLAWGVAYNCGQSCIKPDYAVVHERHVAKLKQLMVAAFAEFYGSKPIESPDYGRQVTSAACVRVQKLLGQDAGEVVCGGEVVAEERYIAPTLLAETPQRSPIMAEELFAPVISVISVKSLDEAIAYVNTVSKQPLSLSVFSSSDANIERCFLECPAGCAISNDVLMNNVAPNLPFGGFGQSGLGTYHGRHSFETFSRRMGVVKKLWNYNTPATDPFIRYPPFVSKPTKGKLFRAAGDLLPNIPAVSLSGIVFAATKLSVLAAAVYYLALLLAKRM